MTQSKHNITELQRSILKRILVVFFERGVKTSMDEIAKILSISKRTIYEQFKNKDEIVLRTIVFMMEESNHEVLNYIREQCNPIEELFPIVHENVRQAYGHRFKFLADVKRLYPDIYKQYNVMYKERNINHLRDIIQRGKQQNLFRKEINEDVILTFMFKESVALSEPKYKMYEQYSMKDIFFNIAVPFMRGLMTQEGIEIFNEVIEKYKQIHRI